MKILFLDDDNNRTEHFLKNTGGADVFCVDTATLAINALKVHGPFDIASLDHDLGGEHYVAYELENHGGAVARYIAANPSCIKHCVVVHSYNGPAAKKMVEEIKAAGVPATHIPFAGWLPNMTTDSQ